MDNRDLFSMKEVAEELDIKGVGRNILYRILREAKVLDEQNFPYPEHIRYGLLEPLYPETPYVTMRKRRFVTRVIGKPGVDFVKETVVDFLAENPVPHPKRLRKPKSVSI